MYSHRAFRATFGVRVILAALGSMAFQGSIKASSLLYRVRWDQAIYIWPFFEQWWYVIEYWTRKLANIESRSCLLQVPKTPIAPCAFFSHLLSLPCCQPPASSRVEVHRRCCPWPVSIPNSFGMAEISRHFTLTSTVTQQQEGFSSHTWAGYSTNLRTRN